MKSHPIRPVIGVIGVIGMMLAMLLAPGLTTLSAQEGGKKEHTFLGKVEKVDAKTKMLTVNGENVQGWMGAMTMSYAVDKEDVLSKVKAGDQITAKVYDGDFKTLHDVQVVPVKTPPAPKK
jgi:Cu/Ag efflux protein CusF